MPGWTSILYPIRYPLGLILGWGGDSINNNIDPSIRKKEVPIDAIIAVIAIFVACIVAIWVFRTVLHMLGGVCFFAIQWLVMMLLYHAFVHYVADGKTIGDIAFFKALDMGTFYSDFEETTKNYIPAMLFK
jgi:hypothetical protein